MKAPDNYLDKINLKAQQIINDVKLKEKRKKLHSKNVFVTIKDHKTSFPNSVDCRLINTMKSDLGKVAKVILDKINSSIRGNTDLLQ